MHEIMKKNCVIFTVIFCVVLIKGIRSGRRQQPETETYYDGLSSLESDAGGISNMLNAGIKAGISMLPPVFQNTDKGHDSEPKQSKSSSNRFLLKSLTDLSNREVVTDKTVDRFMGSIQTENALIEIKSAVIQMLANYLKDKDTYYLIEKKKMWLFRLMVLLIKKAGATVEDLCQILKYVIRQYNMGPEYARKINKYIIKIITRHVANEPLTDDVFQFIDVYLNLITEAAGSVLFHRIDVPDYTYYRGITNLNVAHAYYLIGTLLNRSESAEMPEMPRVVQNIQRGLINLKLLAKLPMISYETTHETTHETINFRPIKAVFKKILRSNSETQKSLLSRSSQGMVDWISRLRSDGPKLRDADNNELDEFLFYFYTSWKTAFMTKYCGEFSSAFHNLKWNIYVFIWEITIFADHDTNYSSLRVKQVLENYQHTLFYQMNMKTFIKLNEEAMRKECAKIEDYLTDAVMKNVYNPECFLAVAVVRQILLHGEIKSKFGEAQIGHFRLEILLNHNWTMPQRFEKYFKEDIELPSFSEDLYRVKVHQVKNTLEQLVPLNPEKPTPRRRTSSSTLKSQSKPKVKQLNGVEKELFESPTKLSSLLRIVAQEECQGRNSFSRQEIVALKMFIQKYQAKYLEVNGQNDEIIDAAMRSVYRANMVNVVN